ncbi:MAG TPA: hemerythrin domain-containing protein [Methylomirabilota bacterium]|nr:hemerythrin domain-containing protein [Methylomirabilota bacterium]
MTEPVRLTEDLLPLLRLHPRESWPSHPNLGDLSKFWLARHDWFRHADAELAAATRAAIDRQVDPARFAPWLAQSLNRFLGELEGHHAVEDQHYFPVFRKLEARLGAGFDLLDGDHDTLHRAIEDIAAAGNAYLTALRADPLAASAALSRFGDVRERLGGGLIRHLGDEEDLIIPIILDRGEDAIGG